MAQSKKLSKQNPHDGIFKDSMVLCPTDVFGTVIDRSLRISRGARLPVSLFAVRVGERDDFDATDAVGEALAPIGFVGQFTDGSVGLLCFGPGAPEQENRARFRRRIVGLVERRLRERGLSELYPKLAIAAVHCEPDEIADSRDLLGGLTERLAIAH